MQRKKVTIRKMIELPITYGGPYRATFGFV